MFRFYKIFFIAAIAASGFFVAEKAKAVAVDACFCYSDLSKASPGDAVTDVTRFNRVCFPISTASLRCESFESGITWQYPECKLPASVLSTPPSPNNSMTACMDLYNIWWPAQLEAVKASQQRYQGGYGEMQGKFINKCLTDAKLTPECADVSIFVQLLINVGNYIFALIGAFALVFFIYGGFLIILSQGEAEKIKKGKDAMVAAVIGLVIAFAAYVVIRFLGDAVGVSSEFMLKL